jgi:hypothetical protein
MNRAVQPISELAITYWAALPGEGPGLSTYVARVSKFIEDHKDSLSRITFRGDKGVHVASSDQNGDPLSVDLGVRSNLWPRGDEPPVGKLALGFQVNFFMHKSPIALENFKPVLSTGPGLPDWSAMSLPSAEQRNRLIFNRKAQRFEIFGSTEFPKALWQNNGQISAIPDLYGAQLFLTVPQGGQIKMPPKLPPKFRQNPEVVKLARMLELRTISIKVKDGREIWLHRDDFKKTVALWGEPVFSAILPSDARGFQKLVSRDE